jgi:hypothetical protein
MRRIGMKPKASMVMWALLLVGVATVSVLSCSGGGGGGGGGPVYVLGDVTKGDPAVTPPTDVEAAVVVASSASFISDITDATVTVNSAGLDFFFIGYLLLSGPPSVNAGEDVTLRVVHGSNTVTSTETMPEQPSISAPTDGTSHDAGSDITVQWGFASTAPDGIYVYVSEDYTASGSDYYSSTLAGTETTHDIPAGTLKTVTSNIPIEVHFVNSTSSFTGDVISGSAYEVEHMEQVTIDTL